MRNQPEEGKMDLTNIDPVILCQDINPEHNEVALISMDWVTRAAAMLDAVDIDVIKRNLRSALNRTDTINNMAEYLELLEGEVNFHKTNYAIEQHVHHEAHVKESFEMMG